jgi:hypothetical protein
VDAGLLGWRSVWLLHLGAATGRPFVMDTRLLGWRDGIYAWNAGYWGPHISFYGGANYGFGYGGIGYEGGRWDNGAFAYNRTVNNFGGVTDV